MTSFLEPLRLAGSNGFQLQNARTGQAVATRLLIAFDSASRRTGLLKHASLPEGSALIIAPTNAIHTFFMRFAIDVAFVARDGRVLRICRALRPWRLAVSLRAFAVIELAAGSLAGADTRRGDRLVVVPEPD